MDKISDTPCIRHAECHFFMDPTSLKTRCQQCSHFRDSFLRCALRRCSEKDSTGVCAPGSHANYRYLDHGQLTERARNLHSLLHNKSRAHARLHDAVAHSFNSGSLPLCSEVGADMKVLMEKYSAEVMSTCEEDSFKQIFWKQQLKSLSLKNRKSMRWHPLIIKWCLYLHFRSSGAYDTLRKSGLIELPSGRTLRDYQHCVPSSVGFSTAVDKQLLRLVNQTQPSPSLARYVGVLIDEMYVKEGLVFNKFTGSLTGFVQLDDISTHLHDYENQCQSQDHVTKRSLAK